MNIRKIELKDNLKAAAMIKAVFHEFDAPKVGTVYSDPLTNKLAETFIDARSVLWVAEEDEVIMGTCGIFPTEGLPENYAELVKFYLAPHARGKGIGKKLFEKSLRSAVDLGYTKIYIESFPQFSTAIGIYEKYGFNYLDQPLGNSGHTSCNIWMIKDLG